MFTNQRAALRADQRVRERRDGELVLKFMGYSPDLMDQQLQLDKDEIFTPGQNDLILSQILSYLSHQHLKEVRFVSKSWSTEALKHLRKQSSVDFYDSDSTRLYRRYDADMNGNDENNLKTIPSWSIHVPTFVSSSSPFTTDEKSKEKYISTLDWFLPKYATNVRKLCLSSFPRDVKSASFIVEIYYKILSSVQNTLTHLELGGKWCTVDNNANDKNLNLECFPFEKIKLYNLTHFTLTLSVGDDFATSVQTWIKSWIPGINQVKRICFKTYYPVTFLELFGELPRLEGISLSRFQPSLQLFTQIPHLAHLDLNNLPNSSLDNITAFEYLLNLHSSTISSLKWIMTKNKENPDRRINLPILPSLKILTVGCAYIDRNEGLPPKLQFNGEDIINYSLHFPSLQSLTLFADTYISYHCPTMSSSNKLSTIIIHHFWNKYHHFFRQFCPPKNKTHPQQMICSTLQVLDVPYEIDQCHVSLRNNEQDYILPRIWGVDLAKMFPSVANNWLNSFRERNDIC